MPLFVNEELLSKMEPEQQALVRAEIARKKKEIDDEEARQAEAKRQAELRKYPPLKQILNRKSFSDSYKLAVLKRTHIIFTDLKMSEAPDPLTIEYGLTLLGKAELSLQLINEIGKILADAGSYSFIKVFPREMVELREHLRKQVELAHQLVRFIAYKKLKDEHLYESLPAKKEAT